MRAPNLSATLAVGSLSTSVYKIATTWRTDGCGGARAALPIAPTSSRRPSSCLKSHSTRNAERKAQTTLPAPALPLAQSWCNADSRGSASGSGKRPSFPLCLVRDTSISARRVARTCTVTREANCVTPMGLNASGPGKRGIAGRPLQSAAPFGALPLMPSRRLTRVFSACTSEARKWAPPTHARMPQMSRRSGTYVAKRSSGESRCSLRMITQRLGIKRLPATKDSMKPWSWGCPLWNGSSATVGGLQPGMALKPPSSSPADEVLQNVPSPSCAKAPSSSSNVSPWRPASPLFE
mmetsp:Transcript_31740/g.87688  ORF Transcript_31740/g.87688 Transcript_31740/m.87688 type:complete len:294 (-) Transcript_31740:600-1481(-)